MFQIEQPVTVRLTKDHRIPRFREDAVEHEALVVYVHPSGEWLDVRLTKKHAGGTERLTVPAHCITAKGE
jgi:hypothetical protein